MREYSEKLFLIMRETIGRWIVLRHAHKNGYEDALLYVTFEHIGSQTTFTIPTKYKEPAELMGTGIKVTILADEIHFEPKENDLIFEIKQTEDGPIFPLQRDGDIYEVGLVRRVYIDKDVVFYTLYADRSEMNAAPRPKGV